MASTEFIQKRIDSVKEKIAKAEATLAKAPLQYEKNIAKAKKVFNDEQIEIGLKNEYTLLNAIPVEERTEEVWKAVEALGSAQAALERKEEAEKKLAGFQADLAKYEADLEDTTEKESSRNVPAITEFLDKWEEKTIQFCLDNYDKMMKESDKVDDLKDEIFYIKQGRGTDDQGRDLKILKQEDPEAFRAYLNSKSRDARFLSDMLQSRWGWMLSFFNGSGTWEQNMRKGIRAEKNRKYDFLISRTQAIVGQITDATNLRIGEGGELDGIVIGTKGKAYIHTIGAGGYNIQRYHFRTLVKPVE